MMLSPDHYRKEGPNDEYRPMRLISIAAKPWSWRKPAELEPYLS